MRKQTKVKYFTKALLQEAAQNAEKWDFNRQLDQDAIKAIPDARYPVELNLLHHHRHGKGAETHMRVVVAMGAAPKGGIAIADVPLEFYRRLPDVKVRYPRAKVRPIPGPNGGAPGMTSNGKEVYPCD